MKELVILYISVAVVMMGYGITLPVLPFYIERFAEAGNNNTFSVSFHVGVITGIFALMQFFFAPLWGKLSDRFGRRPVFVTGLAGYAFSLLLFGMSTSVFMLYVTRIFSGTLSAAVLPVASAYVADMTSREERSRGMAWLGSSVSLGFILGPALGAFLSRSQLHLSLGAANFLANELALCFFAASGLAILAMVAALIWLPESKNYPAEGIKNELTLSENGFRIRNRDKEMKKTGSWLLPIFILAFLAQFALAVFEGTFALHAQQLLQFGPGEMGIIFVLCGAIMALTQAGIVGPVTRRLSELKTIAGGFLISAAGLFLLMLTGRLPLIFVYVSVFAFGMSFIIPNLSSFISSYSRGAAGKVLGQLSAANSLGQASGPAIGAILLSVNFHLPYLLTAVPLIGGGLYLVSGGLSREKL